MDASVGAEPVDGGAVSASEPLAQRPGAEARSYLGVPERRHLERILRAERLYPGFLGANLGVAATLTIYYSWSGSWSGVRAALVLLILLGARAHLRQLRSARLLRKLSGSGAASR